MDPSHFLAIPSPASHLQSPTVDLYSWQAYDPSTKVDLTSTALRLGQRLFLFDPIPLPSLPAVEAEAIGHLIRSSATAIVLTNGNHERSTLALSDSFKLPIYAPADALPEYSPELARRALPLSALPPELEALPLPGGGAGETAFYTPEAGGLAIVGDALIHLPSTGFCLLPERYCEDAGRLRQSVKTLTARPLAGIAFAHGPILSEALAEKIAALPEAG